MERKYGVGTRLVLELGESVQDAVIKVISTKKEPGPKGDSKETYRSKLSET